ncbi:hypothetical protein [Chryseobacterium hagamense]|uniref:Signal peptidase n=1 Tax=Chryseobacterium hagamense TaxID=395935 RepID=A0A511YLV1_9FLAO|nr:hypothetical protein [Chryseobacterium hagamense]GEN76178.1 hypothetical protein CHA01nite_19180 [Chryseobacterium hagamense]
MKKIIILFSLVISGFSLAQSDNPYIYNQPETSEMQEEGTPAGPGDPGGAPIDEYIPALFIVATVLAFAASNRKKQIG